MKKILLNCLLLTGLSFYSLKSGTESNDSKNLNQQIYFIKIERLNNELHYLQDLQQTMQTQLNSKISELENLNKRIKELEKQLANTQMNPESMNDEKTSALIQEYTELSQKIQKHQAELQALVNEFQQKYTMMSNEYTQKYLNLILPKLGASMIVPALAGILEFDATDALIELANADFSKEKKTKSTKETPKKNTPKKNK